MPARRTLRKFALWTCVATPALGAMYFGAYYRMMTPLHALARQTNRFHMQVRPSYAFSWPIPSHWSHPPMQQRLKVVFAPAHQLDRSL